MSVPIPTIRTYDAGDEKLYSYLKLCSPFGFPSCQTYNPLSGYYHGFDTEKAILYLKGTYKITDKDYHILYEILGFNDHHEGGPFLTQEGASSYIKTSDLSNNDCNKRTYKVSTCNDLYLKKEWVDRNLPTPSDWTCGFDPKQAELERQMADISLAVNDLKNDIKSIKRILDLSESSNGAHEQQIREHTVSITMLTTDVVSLQKDVGDILTDKKLTSHKIAQLENFREAHSDQSHDLATLQGVNSAQQKIIKYLLEQFQTTNQRLAVLESKLIS